MKSYLTVTAFLLCYLISAVGWAEQKGEWQGLVTVSPAFLVSDESNKFFTSVSIGARYFLTERLRTDFTLHYGDRFSSNISFEPGFRYYYFGQRERWNLTGGMSVDFGLLRENNIGRPVDLLATPVQMEIHLFKQLYMDLGLAYRKALDGGKFRQQGFESNIGFSIHF